MNVLKSAERKLEGLVEGLFGRAFKTSVQPVELAHKLAKEMGDHKTLGVSSVFVPNEYEVYLGHDDHEKLSSLGDALKAELANYLTAFARREGWTMVAAPRIELMEDDDLRTGEFGIATRTVSADAGAEAASAPAAAAPVAGAAPAAAPRGPVAPAAAVPVVPMAAGAVAPMAAGPSPAQTVLYERPPVAAARYGLRGPGVDTELTNAVSLIGRSRRCDVVLTDPNVSRQHVELRLTGSQVVLRDLGSTNGTRVNRRAVSQVVLQPGDRIEVGTTELLFERLA
jgi:hypothetical protein